MPKKQPSEDVASAKLASAALNAILSSSYVTDLREADETPRTLTERDARQNIDHLPRTKTGRKVSTEKRKPLFRLPGTFKGKSGSRGWKGCPKCLGAVQGAMSRECPIENGGCGYKFPTNASAVETDRVEAAQMAFVDELVSLGFKDVDLIKSHLNPTPKLKIPKNVAALGIGFKASDSGPIYSEGKIVLSLADYFKLAGIQP